MLGRRRLTSLFGETMRCTPELVLFGCLGILCLSGCGGQPNEPGDLSSLFAPPTAAEVAAVRSGWDARDLRSAGWQVLGDGDIGGLRVEVVSHVVEGNTRYGQVRYPERYDPSQRYPVLVFNHGGQNGVSINVLTENGFSNGCLRDFFIVVPSFRGEELGTGELGLGNLASEGEPDELDGDADDAIALLNGVLENMPGAGASRIAVFGRGRGGGASHLMAARDTRISLGVVFSGATDHITHPNLKDRVEAAINDASPLTLPIQTVMDAAMTPFLAGEITLEEARLALIRRSVIHFAGQLPAPYQLHHGTGDDVVSVEHSRRLAARMDELGVAPGDFRAFEYAGGGQGDNMRGSLKHTRELICTLAQSNDGAPDESLLEHYAPLGPFHQVSEQGWHWHDPSRIVKIGDLLTVAITGKENSDGYECGLETWYWDPEDET